MCEKCRMEILIGRVAQYAVDLVDSIETGFFETAEEALVDFIGHSSEQITVAGIKHADGATAQERLEDALNVLNLSEWEVFDDTVRH